jgi:hypothetical protein
MPAILFLFSSRFFFRAFIRKYLNGFRNPQLPCLGPLCFGYPLEILVPVRVCAISKNSANPAAFSAVARS